LKVSITPAPCFLRISECVGALSALNSTLPSQVVITLINREKTMARMGLVAKLRTR